MTENKNILIEPWTLGIEERKRVFRKPGQDRKREAEPQVKRQERGDREEESY